jgi:hypothetical protein
MLYVLAMIVLGAVLGIFHHGVFSGVSILIVVWVLALVGTKIEVTPTDVAQKVWPLYRLSARRDEITAMHWYGRYITFTDADNQVVLKLASLGWQRSQLLDLSEVLGARLYSHRTKSGLGRDRTVGHRLRRQSVGQDTSRSPSGHASG